MSRNLLLIAALSGLAACAGELGDTASTATDPTIEFDIVPPEVDTAMPSYSGGRRRSLETGWRHLPSMNRPPRK